MKPRTILLPDYSNLNFLTRAKNYRPSPLSAKTQNSEADPAISILQIMVRSIHLPIRPAILSQPHSDDMSPHKYRRSGRIG
jgi:hypothetical protein